MKIIRSFSQNGKIRRILLNDGTKFAQEMVLLDVFDTALFKLVVRCNRRQSFCEASEQIIFLEYNYFRTR